MLLQNPLWFPVTLKEVVPVHPPTRRASVLLTHPEIHSPQTLHQGKRWKLENVPETFCWLILNYCVVLSTSRWLISWSSVHAGREGTAHRWARRRSAVVLFPHAIILKTNDRSWIYYYVCFSEHDTETQKSWGLANEPLGQYSGQVYLPLFIRCLFDFFLQVKEWLVCFYLLLCSYAMYIHDWPVFFQLWNTISQTSWTISAKTL